MIHTLHQNPFAMLQLSLQKPTNFKFTYNLNASTRTNLGTTHGKVANTMTILQITMPTNATLTIMQWMVPGTYMEVSPSTIHYKRWGSSERAMIDKIFPPTNHDV